MSGLETLAEWQRSPAPGWSRAAQLTFSPLSPCVWMMEECETTWHPQTRCRAYYAPGSLPNASSRHAVLPAAAGDLDALCREAVRAWDEEPRP